MNPLLLELLKTALGVGGKWALDHLEAALKGKSVPTDALLEAVWPVLRDAVGHGGRLSATERLVLQARLDTALSLVDKGV